MGNFLRFVALIFLVLTGFGTGICGLFGIGGVVVDSMSGHRSGGDEFTGVAIALSALALTVTALCAWGVRALARRMRQPPDTVIDRPAATSTASPPAYAAPPPPPPPPPPPSSPPSA